MRTIKTILIDDERLAREELKSMLSDFEDIEIIAEAKNGNEGVQLIHDLNPDLIFLDVNMPGLSGFDLLKQLEEIPLVVFITAYDEYAMKAFEVEALDYILKPVIPERLKEAVKKVVSKFEEDNLSNGSEQPFSEPKKVLSVNDSVFIKDGEKCWFVELSKIRMLESEGNYVKVHFDQFRPLILRSLGSFEERLDPDHFFRANRKFIVNLKWIDKIENWFNGGLIVELKTGEKVEISRRQAIRFKELWSL